MPSFAHLHVHSEFSLLDGLARLNDLCTTAKASGMDAIALTDHGQMYGMVKFYRAAQEAGIKPIYGCEVYQAPRRMTQREAGKDTKAYHLILLAKNKIGYQNLLKLVSKANLEGFYYRPRIDLPLLAEHAEGLICLSACISGQVPSLLVEGQMAQAREAMGWFKDLFGPDNYYIELQRHEGIPELERVNQQLVSLAREFGLRCVATNDVHYVRRADASAQDLLLAIQTNATMADPDRMRMIGEDYYLMTPDEMAAHMPEWPEAVENTALVAEQCQVEMDLDTYHLPVIDVPEPYTPQSYLRKLCDEGLARRYREITPEIETRLEHELKTIHDMGFDDYFLINADLVQWAKNDARMLVGPGRGSGASSLVGYALGITDLDPLELGLIFERFLNPGRVTMPDIDLDYPEDRRGEVIDYLTQKYGEDRTAQIATFGTMAARGAVRDVGRALGIPLDEVDYVAKLIPSGPKKTISDGLEGVPELNDAYKSKPHIRQLIDYALAVQGLSRHLSTHAAGVIIADKPLVEYTPLQRAPRGEGIISQFCMEDVEAIGLLKLDVLGLSTLTVLDRAFHWIERIHGVTLTQESIPLDDPDTYALLSSGEVTGIFQVESGGMRRTLREMQPTEFNDIVAMLSLYRPGPMQFIPNYINRKFGREEVAYHHPSLEPILDETYGIIVYQEQIIRIASELAGYSPGEADLMRRAVGKKKKKDLEEQHSRFVEGAVERGLPQAAAEAIFADIELFADYGFNKSHSAAYAVITVQTAYLKAHYPIPFLTALLSVDRNNQEKVSLLVGECRRLGIPLRGPDVNRSGIDFTIEAEDAGAEGRSDRRADADAGVDTGASALAEEKRAIRFGLGAIKNVGDGPAAIIVEARGDTPFKDIEDFASRVDLRQVNKRVLECLIRAGAFDTLGERNALLGAIDSMLGVSQELHRAKDVGQRSLFDLQPDMGVAASPSLGLPNVEPLPEKRRLADEKELLGTYVSSHPLDVLANYVDKRLTPLSELDASLEGQTVTVAGVLASLRTITTKKGDAMAFAQLEDLSGAREVVIFPRTYDLSREALLDDTLVLVEAKVQMRDEEVKLIAEGIDPYRLPADARRRQAGATRQVSALLVEVELEDDDQAAARLVERLLEMLVATEGSPRPKAGAADAVPFRFRLNAPQGRVELAFPELFTVYSPQLAGDVRQLAPSSHVAVRWAPS